MAKNSATATASEMLSGLKSKLGFAHNDEDEYADYDEAFDDYNEYDDFDDDGYDSRYDEEYAGYGADYDEHAPVGAYKPVTTKRASGSRFGHGDSSPNLISIDDVKAHTSVPDRLRRDPLDKRTSRTPNRELITPDGPAPSSPAYTASHRESSTRSEGLNSLFKSTTGKGADDAGHSVSGSVRGSGSGSFDPYEAYSGNGSSSHSPERQLTVIKPVAYGDVERVARMVKAGDMVVLGMRNTPDELSKRILDFSFGVASALDASVECPGDKVFAISRGNGLTEVEKAKLRQQGVL